MGTKTCKYCNELKNVTEFEVANIIHGKAYRRNKCKSCKQKQQNGRRYNIAEWFDEYKKTLKCQTCGEGDFRVLDFHHERDKEYDVSNIVKWGHGKEAIMKEVAKCAVLCCKCHRILHYEERKRKTTRV